jgi:hypothetical protein
MGACTCRSCCFGFVCVLEDQSTRKRYNSRKDVVFGLNARNVDKTGVCSAVRGVAAEETLVWARD